MAGGGAQQQGQLPLKFWVVGKCRKKFSTKKSKLWADNTPFVEIWGKIEILSTHNVFCRKFAAVCWKIATFCPAYFLTHDSFHVRCQRRILHISWHDFVSNDEVLSRSGLFDVSYIIRKRRLGLFGHVARLRSDVPANEVW